MSEIEEEIEFNGKNDNLDNHDINSKLENEKLFCF